MKNSYKIIIALGTVLAVALGILGIYALRVSKVPVAEPIPTDEPQRESTEQVVPFSVISEGDDSLYVSKNTAENVNVEDAEILPFEAERFAIKDDLAFYVTVGNEEYAPELRVRKLNAADKGIIDKSLREFISPYGSPAIIGGFIYTAYYGTSANDENAGIFRINAVWDDDEIGYTKLTDGAFYIYGYDDEYIYYTTEDGSSGTVLYRMTLSGEGQTEVLNYKSKSENIVVYGDYIYFSAFDDISHSYKIYRSPKDGHGNIDAYSFECMSGVFDVMDDRLYFQAASSLYSCELNGTDEDKVISYEDDTAAAGGFLKFGDIIYFEEIPKEGGDTRHYRLDTTTVEKTRIDK